MLKNRRLTVLILIFTVASVFLFSCGIALPINLSTKITGSAGSDESTININVKSINEIDFEMVQKGPSLILVYMVTEETSDLKNEINFRTNYAEMKQLNQDYWEDAVYPLFDPKTCDSPLFKYVNIGNDVSAEMYAFKPVLEGEKITNQFNYYLNFKDKNYIHEEKIQDIEGNGIVIPVKFDAENATITIAEENSYYVTAYNPESEFTQHVYVFAAITAQGLNNYVSDLTYVGEFN